jgi:hypothetical protein
MQETQIRKDLLKIAKKFTSNGLVILDISKIEEGSNETKHAI